MDNNPNIIERHKKMQEANKIMENLADNMLNSLDDIANDILKQKDYAIAMAFTTQIGKLLRDNGVVASYAIHEYDETKEDVFTKHYGVVFDNIDFSEHDKEFWEEIEKLKAENESLKNEIEEKSGESYLPYEPIEVARFLIGLSKEMNDFGLNYSKKIYNIPKLRQIAEHLLVYCNNNQGDD